MADDITPTYEQLKIINHSKGAILVLAPVGTGKTFVLARRIIEAINSQVTSPSKVLCLTFTNRAAREMCDRVNKYRVQDGRDITVKTFHSLCAHILRSEAREVGLPVDFVIYDDADCVDLIKEIFKDLDLNVNQDREKIANTLYYKISEAKTNATHFQIPLDSSSEWLFEKFPNQERAIALRYLELMRQRHAIDFSDLIYYVRAIFKKRIDIRDRWGNRFTFVQVDEVQDTHPVEYEIIRELAINHGNLALIGDFDQTIYEWRGSKPAQVIELFKEDFNPTVLDLTVNHRATKFLLKAVDSFAASLAYRKTKIKPADHCEIGEKIVAFRGRNVREEAQWICYQIKLLAEQEASFSYHRTAVLARRNNRCKLIASTLEQNKVPFVNVEQYELYRRQEIKDALAHLRLLINPHDAGALQRVLLRPARGIGERTISQITALGENYGLRLTDMIIPDTLQTGDPFGRLLNALKKGKIVVFDVETTGLSVGKDEIIELAGARLVNGKTDYFRSHLTNTVPVGDSEPIHGYSDSFLREHGRPAKDVLTEFLHFCDGALLVGHNVGFDVSMLSAQANRLGLKTGKLIWEDTYDIARRFVKASNYRLGTLVQELNLRNEATHQAEDDVKATVELLNTLQPFMERQKRNRQKLVNQYGVNFKPLAQQFESWKGAVQVNRPAILLDKVLKESGLRAYYRERLTNLDELIRRFKLWDESSTHSETALRLLLEFMALARNVDYLSEEDNQVRVITIHQAKGLEFDNVFIAGAVEGEMPDFRNKVGSRLEEEKRIFYVAMTRAKKRLFISGHNKNEHGYYCPTSPFLNSIGSDYID